MHIDAKPARGPNSANAQTTIVVGYAGRGVGRGRHRRGETRRGDRDACRCLCGWARVILLDTPYYNTAVRTRHERARRIFNGLSELELGDVTVEAELVDGPAPEALAEVANLRNGREIIVGSGGLGRFRAALSSVSHRLLRLADRPVVVIPNVLTRAGRHRRPA
jgi:hypothetical protein